MPRKNNIDVNGVGYEIKGYFFPSVKRVDLITQEDIELDVPNGDLIKGQKMYARSCGGCHDLDYDHSMGPALRTTYLRKAGTRKMYKHYAVEMKRRPIFWTKRRLWEFLENPEKMYPETNMLFDGVKIYK